MHKVLFLLAIAPVYLISLLPNRVIYFLSRLFSNLLFKIFRYRRDVITTNIARSFPDFRYNDIKRYTNKFYKNFSEIIAENIISISANQAAMSKLLNVENPELLNLYSQRDKALLIIGAHMGNWELLPYIVQGASFTSIGYSSEQLNFIYKKQHSKFSDRFIRWVRTRKNGVNLVESAAAARHIIKNSGSKGCYVLFSDQAPKPGSKFKTNFLNQETFMINGPEIISKAADLPVLFIEMKRERRGKYNIRFHEITSTPKESPAGFITARFAELLEKSICEAPDNWLWSHKRWKRGEAENELKRPQS